MEDQHIQSNVNILLEDYPFLKVFSRNSEYDVFDETYFDILQKIGDMYFRINFQDGIAVSITPYSNTPEIYIRHMIFINRYINYQLVNSGILGVLTDIPIRKLTERFYKRIMDEDGKFVKWEASPHYDTCICIRINARNLSNTITNYHTDSNLFQIIHYNHKEQPYVLGSELLFYYNNDRTNIHRRSVQEKGQPPEFPKGIMGKLIHDGFKLGQKIYKGISSLTSFIQTPPHLRFKLNNGDTVVIADTLWKHAAINPSEQRVDNIVDITIAGHSGDISEKITVCSERIRTTPDEYKGRQIITMPCFLMDKYLEPSGWLEPFMIDSPLLDIPTFNLGQEDCQTFLTQLIIGNSCIDIGKGVKIKSRGGVNKKKKRKHTKNKKINHRKTFKK
jgi:hypothetical protein